MKVFSKFVLVSVLFMAASLPSVLHAQGPASIADWFEKNPAWTVAESVELPAGASQFAITGEGNGGIYVYRTRSSKGPQLHTRGYIGDFVMHLEYMSTPEARAGVYLEGRYRIELARAAKAGEWHTFDARFRTPRLDDARNKTQEALILEVRIDGKLLEANTVPSSRSEGTEFNWDDFGGPSTISVEEGGFAIRNFSLRRADFDAVKLPAESGGLTNSAKLVDYVRQGEDLFRGLGCVECHAVQRDDNSVKTGPNLFGLFTLEPRDRVITSGGEGHRFTIKTDRAYLQRSVRTPLEEVAISERGANKGQPFLPVMPAYAPAVLSDAQIDAIASYLATLNEPGQQGPVVRLVEPAGLKNYDPLTDRLQILVDQEVRIQRGPMDGVSGRSIHVGQPNGVNYTFDPRVLGIAKIWQGGFLDTTGEYLNRGGQGLKPGYESREIELGKAEVLLAPIGAHDAAVDLSFKEPKFRDSETIRKGLNDPRDHLAKLAEADAQFLGYSRNSKDPLASPVFKYRVGRNTMAVRAEIGADGRTRLIVTGDFAAPQSFAVDEAVLGKVTVSAGSLTGGRWTIPAGTHGDAVLEGKLTLAPNAWRPKPSTFDYRKQPLVVDAAEATLPDGYRTETYRSPRDNYGREQLFEPLGITVAPDGTIVVSTRTAGIWRLREGEWTLLAEGLFDSLGVQVEDQDGHRVVAGQKAELTRITDTNGDGLADSFETLMDQFEYTGNYHGYMHGPVPDGKGGYFVTLNLNDSGGNDYEYRAGGRYMGTSGGYRGWAIHVPAAGGFEPWADGLRSPAGLGVSPDGRLWYADNQGEYVGTSKLFLLEKGQFYGHPAGLVDRPGMVPTSPEISWPQVKEHREKAVVLFPQNRLANSPGNPAWDTTGGKFGPFAGQMFIGDQTQSDLIRVTTEKVGSHEQGVAIPFATNLQSGLMRPVFLPDGSLLIGQTGRGWQAKGGHVSSLQRLIWDGKTTPLAIQNVKAIPGGFDIQLTMPVPTDMDVKKIGDVVAVKSWVYRDAPDYGSPELDEHSEAVASVAVSSDRRSLKVLLASTVQPKIHPDQTARVYHLGVDGKTLWGAAGRPLEAYYTLYEFPKLR